MQNSSYAPPRNWRINCGQKKSNKKRTRESPGGVRKTRFSIAVERAISSSRDLSTIRELGGDYKREREKKTGEPKKTRKANGRNQTRRDIFSVTAGPSALTSLRPCS